jgi:hypothetical protein
MANSRANSAMELQPVVGSACAHCQKKILVAVDGRNCPRCGLALHRACAGAHRGECAGRPMLERAQRDYDEVAPLQWTARLIALLSLGAFLVAMGLGALLAAPPEVAFGQAPPPPSTLRLVLGWGGLAAGLLVLGAGYAWERARQGRPATKS